MCSIPRLSHDSVHAQLQHRYLFISELLYFQVMERNWVERGRSWYLTLHPNNCGCDSRADACNLTYTSPSSSVNSWPIVYHFLFFLKNNTDNVTWKRLLKIITLLQDSRFDILKEENTFTQKYIFIYLYSFRGIWPGQQSGTRPVV